MSSSTDCSLKSLTSPGANELLQSHNSLTFKLLKTVADFSQALASLHENFGHELQLLVENFRKRNGELRKERLHCANGLFKVWELFLQQVEVNSQQHGDISRQFNQRLARNLVERLFHRKIQSKKIFAHRDRIETILLKSSELLLKCHQDYCQAYALALTNPAQHMSEYIGSHNVYVHQLQATNGMIHAYQTKTLPKLLEELEECHLDTSSNISSSLLESSELVSEKSTEQATGYQTIANACKQANHKQDLAQFVKLAHQQPHTLLATPTLPSNQSAANQSLSELTSSGPNSNSNSNNNKNNNNNNSSGQLDPSDQQQLELKSSIVRYHQFQSPNVQSLDHSQFDSKNLKIVPTFKNEIAPDLSQPPAQQQPQLESDRNDLEEKIARLEERIESLHKLLVRSHESGLHNKVNEFQEELCQKRFDLQVAQIHLSAVRSQLQLFEYNYRPQMAVAAGAGLVGGEVNSLIGGGGGVSASGDFTNLQLLSNGGAQGGGGAGSGGLGLVSGSGGGGGILAGGSLNSVGVSGGGSGVGVGALGYKNKWIKAFKSLKQETPAASSSPSSVSSSGIGGATQKFNEDKLDLMQQASQQQQQSSNNQQQQQQQQQAENQHFFQEYTFKKIASCDVCKDFLRGHMRQGVKCKLCKISSHNECQSKAHATIKCQQPKIKLLRRQKSAGELEVNNWDNNTDNGDSNERTTLSSKPDTIYQLIRQVLDAKKKGQQQHQQLHQGAANPFGGGAGDQAGDHHLRVGGLGQNAMMNLSTGNLALANADGKSVSTSALIGTGSSAAAAAVSVDRWAVVMDLLAESRHRKDDPTSPTTGANNLTTATAGGGKRHSKQLDKFKLAAKSAATVSKHKQYYLQQHQRQSHQQQQQSEDSSPPPPQSMQQQHHSSSSQPASLSPQRGPDQQHAEQQQQRHHSSGGGATEQQMHSPLRQAATVALTSASANSGYMNQQQQQAAALFSSSSSGQQMHHAHHHHLLPNPNDHAYLNQQQQQHHQQQQLHLHHTKSLPVGKTTIQQQQQQAHHLGHLMNTNQMLSGNNDTTQQMVNHMQAGAAGGGGGGNLIYQQHHQQQQHQHQYQNQHQQQQQHHQHQQQQLLDICDSQQQLQSTSEAPHSPQRKRFNLRMKSFSLDSPENPSVAGIGTVGGAATNYTSATNNSTNTIHQQHQQQPPASHLHSSGGNLSQLTDHQHSSAAQAAQIHQHLMQSYSSSSTVPNHHHSHHQHQHNNNNQHHLQDNLTHPHHHHAHYLSNQHLYLSGGGNQQQQQQSGVGGGGQHNYLQPNYGASPYLGGGAAAELAAANDSQLSAYLSANRNPAAGSGNGQQPLYQHRHSYHNHCPTFAYTISASGQQQQQQSLQHQQQQHHHLQLMAGGREAGGMVSACTQQSSSQSALNSLMPSSANHHQQQQLDFSSLMQLTGADKVNKKQQQQQKASATQTSGGAAKSNGLKSASTKTTTTTTNSSSTTADNEHKHSLHHLSSDSLHHTNPGPEAANARNNNNNINNNNNEYYDLNLDVSQQQQPGAGSTAPPTTNQVAGSGAGASGTYVVLYDYLAQRADEIQLQAGQLVCLLDPQERDWWKVSPLDGTQRAGYFPSSYLTRLYQNERPLQVIQTIQVSNGETYDKLLRGQIVIHTGKQMDGFVSIRTVLNGGDLVGGPTSASTLNAGNHIQCPEKYLMEVVEVG